MLGARAPREATPANGRGVSVSVCLDTRSLNKKRKRKTMDYCYRLDLVPYTVTVQGLTAVTASQMSA